MSNLNIEASAFTNQNELEAKKQLEIMQELRAMNDTQFQESGVRKTFHIETFGCQMNSRDSEKIEGILNKIGYEKTDTEDADFVILNTCTVRENANNKVYGHLGALQNKKKKRPGMMIALCGCMMQEDIVVEKLRTSYRFVDIIFGTHNIFKLAELIKTRINSNRMVIDIWKETDMIVENLPSDRKYPFKAGVNIMFGCNNFCSYCIVPYVRGRERSRNPEDIIDEITKLAEDGVKEIMLLGQNVNSYGKNLAQPMTFAQLLNEVEKVKGIERIRFMTSHPKDLSDELIEVMKNSKKICHHLHLPVQSGSTKLLKKMNRRYTKESYLELVEKIKTAVPDISLTTDIIVGFPGETEEDFLDTMDVVEKVGYDNAFTFLYSKRTGTPAATYENQVEESVAKNRFDRLLKKVQELAAQSANKLTGSEQYVLVEERNDHDHSLMTGRLENNLLVHFPGEDSMIGSVVKVRLVECKNFYYLGELITK